MNAYPSLEAPIGFRSRAPLPWGESALHSSRSSAKAASTPAVDGGGQTLPVRCLISPSASLVGSEVCVHAWAKSLCPHHGGDGELPSPWMEPRGLCALPGQLREGIPEKSPSVLPSLSTSFLPLRQSIPVSIPSKVSILAPAALPCACSIADRTQVPSIPASAGDNIRAVYNQQENGLGR